MFCQYSECDCVVVDQIENACADCELRQKAKLANLLAYKCKGSFLKCFQQGSCQKCSEVTGTAEYLYLHNVRVMDPEAVEKPNSSFRAIPVYTPEQLAKCCLEKNDNGESK